MDIQSSDQRIGGLYSFLPTVNKSIKCNVVVALCEIPNNHCCVIVAYPSFSDAIHFFQAAILSVWFFFRKQATHNKYLMEKIVIAQLL